MLKIVFNDKILDENKINFSIYNRAFLYGDGLFESIKIIKPAKEPIIIELV